MSGKSAVLHLRINEADNIAVEVPYDVIEAQETDPSILVNIVQEYVSEEIKTLQVIRQEEVQASTEEQKIWTDDNVIILIELYKKYAAEFEKGIKKHVWTKIGRILSEKIGIEVSGIQCDTKWKGLLKHYKLVKKHNDTSGNEPKYWKFYDVLNDILHKKPEIEPVATCSSAKGLQRNEENDVAYGNDCASSSSGTSTPTPTNKRKRRTIENSAEKRHRERLQRQDRFLDILQDIANTMKNKNCGGPEKE